MQMNPHAICLLIILSSCVIAGGFSPDNSDSDAYGIKIAANDILFVQSRSQDCSYLFRFAPYNNSNGLLQCSCPCFDQSHYVYSVAVGSSQIDTKEPYVYYAGEINLTYSPDGDANGNKGAFIGILINRDPTSVQMYLNSGRPVSCENVSAEGLQFLSTYGHQEYFVIAVEPFGRFAIGLATDFVFRYQPFPNSMMTNQSTNTTWPTGSTFHPCAADATISFTVVAGFVKNSVKSRAHATPIVHILSNDNLTVIATWTYAPPENSWQSYLTYAGIDKWNKKFTMSVKINTDDDPTRVLIGMPFLNTVFLFVVSNQGTNLALASSVSYNKSVGFGKGVTWLSNTQAAILYSAYSPDYLAFYWSKVYVYTGLSGTNLPSTPTAVIPNAQQPLSSTINANFIRLISTPSSVAILDKDGGVLLIRSEAPGSYASTDINSSPVAAIMPVITQTARCIGGTFKADVGVHPCAPCPVGSRNPGDVGAAACINCSSDAFCPLGAVYEVDRAALSSLSQSYPYPRSPELTVYEDLLINNMVSFGSSSHCRRISPMFWTVILLVLVTLMLLGMASLNLCVEEPRRDRWRSLIKSVFLRTDLVVSIH